MNLSFAQWVRLGFGVMALSKKHAAALPAVIAFTEDALVLWRSVVGEPVATPNVVMSHTDAIAKLRSGALSDADKAAMDRASKSFG